MSFWDQLSDKISSGAASVSDSAKRMAEVVKLNNKIDSLTSEIERKYADMGRIVKRELMSVVDNDEVKAIAFEIDKMTEEVSEKRKEVNKLKGVKTCANCGVKLASGDTFCPSCGSKQADDVIVEDADNDAQEELSDKVVEISDEDVEIVSDGEENV